MLDPRLFRSDLEHVKQQLDRRSYAFDADAYEALENKRKTVQISTQDLQNEKNKSAKSIGQAKAKGEDIQPLLDQVQHLGDQLKEAEAELSVIQTEMSAIMQAIPNFLDELVPAGKTEDDNVEISRWGELPAFSFEPKDHVDLGESKGLDFELAAKITSARFAVLQGPLARLQRAIIQLMLDTHVAEHGYSETYVPYLVNAESL